MEDSLIAVQQDYGRKGVQVVAVNVNNLPADRLEPMKVRAKEKEFNFPYLFDETQEVAKAYRAACTPDFFLFDSEHRLAYPGISRHVLKRAVQEDVAQEVLIAVARSIHRYRGDSKFTTWLYTIARNLCVDNARRAKHRKAASILVEHAIAARISPALHCRPMYIS